MTTPLVNAPTVSSRFVPICTFNWLAPPPITKGPAPVLIIPLATKRTLELLEVCVPPLPAYWIVLTFRCGCANEPFAVIV